MPIILDGTAGLTNNATDLNYTGTLTGGTGVVNLGSGQVYKDASGNVGIGTSSPVSAVTVFRTSAPANPIGSVLNSAARLQTAAASFNEKAEIQFQAGSTAANTGEVIAAISSLYTTFNGANNAGGDLLFSTRLSTAAGGLSERMRIDSSGNLLVGTTSGASFRQRLYCNGFTNNGIVIATTENASGFIYASFKDQTDTTIGSITRTGTSSIVSYATSSDYRLKTNITPMTNGLDAVSQLKPCTYKWKKDGSAGQGFIAHELQAVVPDCVTGERDAVDAEGKPQYQGVDTSFLVATLTAAIQELKAIVDAQAARITALEGTQ